MSSETWALEAFNAKRLSAVEVAASFVPPPAFPLLLGSDHCYVLGPRGSGKTTLLRMLQGESIAASTGGVGRDLRNRVKYSAIFLASDELWASQSEPKFARASFAAQMLHALVETMLYRIARNDSFGNEVHLPAQLAPEDEALLASDCATAWKITPRIFGLHGLLTALELKIITLQTEELDPRDPLVASDAMSLIGFGIKAFNQAVRQPNHRWALLLDEMEIAPVEIHNQVHSFVRGGSAPLIVKISMSPFDRYGSSIGATKTAPIPGHDFQTIYLADMQASDARDFTQGLWRGVLATNSIDHISMERALGRSAIDLPGRTSQAQEREVIRVLRQSRTNDPEFARWLKLRSINLDSLDEMTYNQRSATVRKVYPLLVFRDALTTVRSGKVVRRSRKKNLDAFTGARAVTLALEGNPRWAKSAFATMLSDMDPRTRTVDRGRQFDALNQLAIRFEALLRVLPSRNPFGMPVGELVDVIANYFSSQNTGVFSPDPKGCFTIDHDAGPEIIDTIILGLYAGAIVHIRDRRSPALITDLHGQRFRLAYLLGIRERREFPLRRGKDVRLGRILDDARRDGRLPHESADQLDLDI